MAYFNFVGESNELSFICETAGELNPSLFECWSEEIQSCISMHSTKDCDTITLCFIIDGVNESTQRVLERLK